ncbi:MAG: 3'-5' exoribonuclease YhaM family protein [bacterium]
MASVCKIGTMKHQFVKDLNPGTPVNDVFFCTRLDLKERRDGGRFITFELRDRTGSLPAIMWDNIEDGLTYIAAGGFCHVQGKAADYQGRLQITVSALFPVDPCQISRGDFIPVTRFNRTELLQEIKNYIASIKNSALRQLLESFFNDPKFVDQFTLAPAAVRVHHAYLGGLLEHTVMMCRQVNPLCDTYPELDRDLIFTGVILHDVGKIREYCYDMVIDHTDEGKLLGHIVLGYQMVLEKINLIPDFPAVLRKTLLHIILAHHGENEYGSPKIPKFPEAFIVFALDYLDSRLAIFRNAIEKTKGVHWTDFNDFLDTDIYIKDRPETDLCQ